MFARGTCDDVGRLLHWIQADEVLYGFREEYNLAKNPFKWENEMKLFTSKQGNTIYRIIRY